jgi:outer membrane protein TolC
MKTITYITIFFLLATGSIQASFAQTAGKADSINDPVELELPALLTLIDSAIRHNAMIEFRKHEIEEKSLNVTTQKNYWLRNMGIQSDTRYGTFDNFLSSANSGGTTLQSITTKQFNYGFGLYIKLPVFDVVNRKTQIKQAKAELDQARSMAQAQEDDIRQMVIRQYHDILLKQKLLSIKSQSFGSATVNMDMIEKQFRNGLIPIVEYVRIADMTSKTQAEYEVAKADFILAKKLLEDFVGFSFGKK